MEFWVRPRKSLVVPHRHVMVWAGQRGVKREAVVQATRAGEVRIRYLTQEESQGFWIRYSRIISIKVESGQEELDI